MAVEVVAVSGGGDGGGAELRWFTVVTAVEGEVELGGESDEGEGEAIDDYKFTLFSVF